MSEKRVSLAPRNEMPDEQLVMRYRQSRDRELFEEVVRRYETEIYTFLRRFLGDIQQAEDVFQATFLAVHLRIDQFEEGRRFRPWLYAIATNKAIDSQRRTRRHRLMSIDASYGDQGSESTDSIAAQIASDEGSPADEVLTEEMSAQMKRALSELNDPTQELIQLAFFQGRKYSDISEKLKIPVGTVKSRVHTAMKRLRDVWRKLYGNIEP